jgi:SulP family sulfate permease
MMATVIAVVWTHDLAQGVLVGVLLSGIFFASKVRKLFAVDTSLAENGSTRTYHFTGQIFFASVERFLDSFDFGEVIEKVVIDVRQAHFWDISAVAALDKAVIKLRRDGTEVEVLGLNEASATMIDRFGISGKDNAEALMAAH